MKLVSSMVADGVAREFALTRSPMKVGAGLYRLPKARPSSRFVSIVVDGAPFVAPVTDNKAWSKSADKFLEYIWVLDGKGSAWYVTLGYGETVEDFAGAEFSFREGVGPKPPVRIADGDKAVEGTAAFREAERVRKFSESWVENRTAEAAE